jgi:hypothetical protein
MNPIKIPTDNLYKFIAVTGLIVFAASFLLLFYGLFWSANKMIILTNEYDKLNGEMHYMKSINDYKDGEEFLDKDYFMLDVGLYNCKRVRENLFSFLYIFSFLCFGISLCGLATTFIGFKLWHCKLQKYQDKIIRDSATKLNKNTNAKI